MNARATEWVDGQSNARAANRLHVDDVAQIAHVRVEIVVPVRRSGAQCPRVRHAIDVVEAGLHQVVGLRFDPIGDIRISGPAVGCVVLEPSIVWWIVRRSNHDAVGQPRRASAVVAENGMGQHRRRRVLIVLREHDVDAVCGEHLNRSCARGHRQRVCVDAKIERAVDDLLSAVAADGLADRDHVGFVERPIERRPAVARRAERHALGGHRGIGHFSVVSRHQPGYVEQHLRRRRMARKRADAHGCLLQKRKVDS